MTDIELVFAYGSNMNVAQMKKRCPDSKDKLKPFVAKAEGWKLCFPRYSLNRKEGVGSIVRAPGEIVWGVVYEVATLQDLRSLDKSEGVFVNSYHRERLRVRSVDEKEFETWTYFAVPEDNPPIHYAPNREYLALYIRGAEYFNIDKTYIEELKGIEPAAGGAA